MGGVAFGMVFSALVFAGEHQRFRDLDSVILAGIIYAIQYELTGRLSRSIVHAPHTCVSQLSFVPTSPRLLTSSMSSV